MTQTLSPLTMSCPHRDRRLRLLRGGPARSQGHAGCHRPAPEDVNPAIHGLTRDQIEHEVDKLVKGWV